MSTTLEVCFISGRVHGTPWGASHNEGRIEFPPSPWRLTRALIATWFERANEIDEAVIRRLVERLASVSPRFYVPPFAGAHVRHYFPESAYKVGSRKGTAKVLDAFAAVDPNVPLIVEWDVELPSDERSALATLVDRMPYIGRAESLVEVRLLDVDEPGAVADDHRLLEARLPTQNDSTSVRLLAGRSPLNWDAALQVPWKLRQKGFIDPPSTERIVYTSREPLEWDMASPRLRSAAIGPRAIEWKVRGKGRIPITAAVAYGDILRKAIIKQASVQGVELDWRFLGKEGGAPSDRHHEHAHFLPIDDPEDGRFLRGLLLWVPAGLDDDVMSAALSVGRLWAGDAKGESRAGLRDFRPVRLFVQRFGDPRGWTKMPLVEPSAVWETLTPYAPARHLRTDGRMEKSLQKEITRELSERGKPEALTVEMLFTGGSQAASQPGDGGHDLIHPLDFRRHRANGKEHLRDGRRAFHVRLTFASPISGPIAIGALSHFGLGVFAPSRPSSM